MKTFFLVGLVLFAQIAWAQVGIGTNTPSVNSVLDLSSMDKGLMLPRVNDTSSITSPTAGLLIFNKTAKAPAFHNGTNWNTFAATTTTTTGTDSLTYSSSGPGTPGITAGQFRAENISLSGGTPQPGVSEFVAAFSKYADVNSVAMQQAFLNNSSQGTIEFFYYKQGSATPYKSIKLGVVRILSLQYGLSDNGASGNGVTSETFQVSFSTYGYKDWVNNKSFSYDLSTKTIGSY